MARRNLPRSKSFASHPTSKYWSNENNVKPWQIYKNSAKKFKFDCPICFHTYETQPYSIVKGSGCGYCANKYLCDDKNCEACRKKSFRSHPASKYWSQENEVSSRQVFKNSSKKYLFDCGICDHTFDSTLSNVIKGTFCPYCANSLLCSDDECKTCREKSFVTNDKANFWSDENKVRPHQVFKSSHKKYKFDCNDCDHTFEISPADITHGNHFCPFCSSQKLCLDDNCKTCYNRSFKSFSKSDYWSSDNGIDPRQVFKYSTKKYKFDCPYCKQIYEAQVCNVTNGNWCNCKRNKTETILYEVLQMVTDNSTIRQKKFKWCKRTNCLPFDFCIKDLKLIIELDGIQHFKQVANWKSPNKIQKNDIYKMKCANQHGYSIIRIFQDDVMRNRNNWKHKLFSHIAKYDKPTNILIGKIYKDHPVYQDV